jgi:membrane-bound lytic murein transglycosylase D
MAALAYNCGETKLARVLKKEQNHKLSHLIDDDLKLLPKETRRYMRRIIIAAMFAYDEEIIVKNNADHLFGSCTNSKLIEVFFNGGSTLRNIAHKVGIAVKKIKTCNPHLLKAKLPINKKTYHVYLPEEYVKDLNNTEITIGRFTYNIKEGDTISKISKLYNIRISAIKRLNPEITNKLKIGQIITLIGTQKIAKN